MLTILDCSHLSRNFRPFCLRYHPKKNQKFSIMSVPDQENQTDRLCDFCNEPKALLYCRADSAKLCFNCDREVHSTNQLFKKHTRSLLCDSCNSAPSSIFCCTESAVLCQNCDWETHSSFRSIHDRRPLEGFNGCPSVSELLNFLGLEDLGKKSLDFDGGDDEGLLDLLVWETPSVVTLDDLIGSNGSLVSGHSLQVMGVPPLPKNRNAACGKHKQEILRQLGEMAKAEPDFSGCLEDFEPLGFQSEIARKCELRDSSPGLEDNAEPISVPSYETNPLKWGDFPDEGFPSTFVGSFTEMKTNHLVSDKDYYFSDSKGIENIVQEGQPCVPGDSKTFQVLPKVGVRELNNRERETAISRYKEKKKTRRYDKHIRYESRKVGAESRIRIKGRFAKTDR